MSSSVLINDKNHFKSKGAVIRLKKDIKANIEGNNLHKIDSSKYLIDGFNFNLNHDKKNKIINVTVITSEEFSKLEQRRELKQRLHNAKYKRSGKPKQQMNSLKRSVPEKIFKAYTDIIRKYSFDIPSPDSVINDVDKYKLQISMLMNTTHKISNIQDADNKVKKYFKLLGELLDIEPIEIPMQNNNLEPVHQTIHENNQDATDTEEEDEPQLIEINE